MRYDALIQLAKMLRPQRILEIGVAKGATARKLLAETEADYVGVDLFEDLSPEVSKAEGNGKAVGSRQGVTDVLNEFFHGRFELWKGRSEAVVPDIPGEFDFIFIDGGHSQDTIATDFSNALAKLIEGGTIVLDDYYDGEHEHGCQHLVDALDRNDFRVRLVEPPDKMDGRLIRLVEVTPY